MSPAQFNGKGTYPSPLKINKDSHFIKKSTSPPPPSSSSSSSSASSSTSAATKPPPPHRHPVIIYTHSPKIIHTHPRDFMALVQKLTGLSRSDSDDPDRPPPPPKQEPGGGAPAETNRNRRRVAAAAATDDGEESSVVTEEHGGSAAVGNVRINSCFPPPTQTVSFFDPPPVPPLINPCFSNFSIPFLPPNPTDFFTSAAHQPFFSSYNESLVLMNNTMRSSIPSSSSSTFDGLKAEFREF